MKTSTNPRHVNEIMRDMVNREPTEQEKRQRREQLASVYIPIIRRILEEEK